MKLTWDQMTDIFKKASTSVEARHFTGGRAQDQLAWFSPQRDLVNLMPALLNATCALCQFTLTEEEQESLGTLPLDLYHMAASQSSGAAYMIPQTMADAIERAPESVLKFVTCFGLATLMVQGLLPVFSVKQDGTPAEKMSPDVTLAVAFSVFDPSFRAKAMAKLKKLSVSNIEGLFSDEIAKLVDDLKNLDGGVSDEQ